MQQTQNYNLNKLENADTADLTQFNPNWDTIDAKLNEHDAHLADGVKHTSQAEKDAWNSKAAGNHDHAGVYEPVFTKNTAFNKNFGTTSGTVCQGNDARLSDSRKCDNTFDNAATARTNLGLTGNSNTTHYHDGRYAQTRVSGGKLQYYDGSWKDVGGVIATKPRAVGLVQSAATSTYYTLLNVSGSGVLSRISTHVYNNADGDGEDNNKQNIRITVDGTAYTYDPSDTNFAASFGGRGDIDISDESRRYDFFDMIFNIQFLSSLKIEVMQDAGNGRYIHAFANYGLV